MGRRRKKNAKNAAVNAEPPKERTLEAILDSAWQQFHNAAADIQTNGAVHVTDKGYRYANPAINQRKEAAALIARLQAQLDAQNKSKPAPGVIARKR